MWDDSNEREMRAQQAAETDATQVDQLLEQLEMTLDEIAQAEAEFRIYEQGERDPI